MRNNIRTILPSLYAMMVTAILSVLFCVGLVSCGSDDSNEETSTDAYTMCRNANHPHWIDMGLPSGTQWRCCNEGASTPESYGGYYAFGQVSSVPTQVQIKEFLDNTTSVWMTLNGVNGRKFTSKINGSSVFLPAAGYRWNGELILVGTGGYYWSSTPHGEYNAYGLYFDSYGAGWDYWGDNRDDGQSVRPVR